LTDLLSIKWQLVNGYRFIIVWKTTKKNTATISLRLAYENGKQTFPEKHMRV